VSHRAGKPTTEADVALLLENDADVYKPDGTPLVSLRRNAIPTEMCEAAYPALHEMRNYGSDNRGKYAGYERSQARFGDGVLSKQSRTRDANGKIMVVPSAIVGYFDRQGGRFPFCRQTAFVGKEPAKWKSVMPMVHHVAGEMQRAFPARYAKQQAEANRTHKAFVIGTTPFTTLTVNNNVVGTIHQDKGDFKDGIGCISVVRRGEYEGAWLTFPEFSCGVDLRDGDLLFFNSHDWHGVTAFKNAKEGFQRISVVYYFRARMTECGSPAEEMQRARSRYGSLSEPGEVLGEREEGR
jgi:hypothetical protein